VKISDSPEFRVTRYKNSEKFAKFREKFVQICRKNNEFDSKNLKSKKLQDLQQQNIAKRLTKIYEFFEFGAVQKNANLVDLEKRCKMSIWSLS
jgi:hypothetical protein